MPLSPDVFYVGVDRPNYDDWDRLILHSTKPVIKAYTHFASPEEFWAMADKVQRRTPLCAYEVVPEGTPVRGFFDLEVDPAEAWDGDELRMCRMTLDLLNEVAGPLGHPHTTLADCTVSCASVPAKRSCHLVVLNAWWPCISDLRRVVAVMLRKAAALQYMRPAKDGGAPKPYCLLDSTTGHKQLYRTVWSYKAKSDPVADLVVATRRLEPMLLPGMAPLESRTRDDYLATGMGRDWLDCRHRMDLSTALAAASLPAPIASRSVGGGGSHPAATTELEARIQQHCTEHSVDVPIRPGTCNEDGFWQCDRAGVCAVAGRAHRSNRARCRVWGALVQHSCYNADCRAKGWQTLFSLVQFDSAGDGSAAADAPAAVHSESESDSDSEDAAETEKSTPPSYASATEASASVSKKDELAALQSRQRQVKKEMKEEKDRKNAEREQRKLKLDAAKAKRAPKGGDADDEGFVHVVPRQAEQSDKEASAAARMRARVADFQTVFGGRTDELCLPAADIVRWWLKTGLKVVEEDIAQQARELLEKTVLPFCNHYWKLINSKQTAVVYKAVVISDKGASAARKWAYLPRFHWVQVRLSEFRSGHLPTFRVSKKTVAEQWSRWHGAESYPGTDRLSQHARVQPHKDVLNTWTGTPVRPEHCAGADASDESDGGNAEKFIVEALCSTEGREVGLHFWRWLCICWVWAGYRTNLCCLLFGSGGSGKSLVALLLLYLFGRELFVCIPSAASVLGNFNGQLRDKVMAWFDELHLTDMAMNDKLKENITAEDIEINDKNEKVVHQTNCLNYGGSSNKHSIISPDHDGTRKFLLIKCQRSGCLMPAWSTREAIDRLVHTDVYSLGARMMKTVAELPANFDISKNVPQTLGLQAVKRIASGKDYVSTWWTACIEGDCLLCLDKAWGQWVPISKLLESYHRHFDKNTRALEVVPSSRLLMSRLEVFSGALQRATKTKAQLGSIADQRETAKCCLLPSKEDAADAMGIDRSVDPFAETIAAALKEEQQAAAAQERSEQQQEGSAKKRGSGSGKDEAQHSGKQEQ